MARYLNRLFPSVIGAWLIASVAVAAPISTYPPATTPLAGTEQMISTQSGKTVNVTPAMISSYTGGAITTTGPYSGEFAQPLPPGGVPPCLNIFRYLTATQQAKVTAFTTTTADVDFQPIFMAAIAAAAYGPGAASNEICLPPGKYPFGSTLDIKNAVIVRGAGGGGGLAGTQAATLLVFPNDTPGIILDQFNTLGCAPAASGTSAAGTVIRDLAISGGGTSSSAHGIHACVRFVLNNVNILNFPGHELWVDGTNGNANESSITNLNCQSATSDWCIYEAGSDANASSYRSIGIINSGGGGICACGFLGSAYHEVHADLWGSLGLGEVTQSGHKFALISRTAGIGASTTPTIGMTTPWYDEGAGSGPPVWSGSGTYQVSSGIFADGAVSSNTFYSPYMEPGNGPISSVTRPSLVVMPQNGGLTLQTASINVGFGIGGVIYSPTGFGGFQFYPSGDARGLYGLSYANFDGLHAGDNLGVLRIGGYASSNASKDMLFQVDNAQIAGLITLTNTTQQFGSGAAQPFTWLIDKLALGQGLHNGVATIQVYGTAAPTTGSHARGEIVWNQNTAAGSPAFWMNTATGSPGTWLPGPIVPLAPAVAPTVVASLPACSSTNKYSRGWITDGSGPTFLGTLTGGGSVVAPVFCNGSAWVAG